MTEAHTATAVVGKGWFSQFSICRRRRHRKGKFNKIHYYKIVRVVGSSPFEIYRSNRFVSANISSINVICVRVLDLAENKVYDVCWLFVCIWECL